MSRDELIPALLAGKGDVVMSNLTVTPERQKRRTLGIEWRGIVLEVGLWIFNSFGTIRPRLRFFVM